MYVELIVQYSYCYWPYAEWLGEITVYCKTVRFISSLTYFDPYF